MQHGKIIIQEAQSVIEHAESHLILHWQYDERFIMF